MTHISFTSGQILDIISALEEVENSLYDAENKHLAVYYMNLASQFHRMYDKLQALPGEQRVANLIVSSD
jgi:arginyl-tRNA synthetase